MNTSIPEIVNPLKHSGTNRFERLADALKASYVQIEERHEADFLQYATKLAGNFQFYDGQNSAIGDWKELFDDQVPTDQPHKALFIAFLRLLEALNEHANGLTKRHLDFYYKDVLQFAEREVKPAHVHLFMTRAGSLRDRFVAQSETLNAGENREGKKILFQLVDELVVNHAKVDAYHALYKHNEDFGNRFVAKNYSNFLTVDTEENKEGFPTFGSQQLEFEKVNGKFLPVWVQEAAQTMDNATLGFAFASPVLRMKEGLRTITLRLDFANPILPEFDLADFKIALTAEENWLELTEDSVSVSSDKEASEITLTIALADTDAAIVDYDAELHAGAYQATSPVLRLVLAHNRSRKFGYTNWKDMHLREAGITVNAIGVRSLIVQNDISTLDPSKPFRPYGPMPSIGNHFYVGHQEVFRNKLKTASLHLDWKDIPAEKFSTHYADYQEPITNDSFKVSVSMLDRKVWQELTPATNLFDSSSAYLSSEIKLEVQNLNGFERKTDNRPINGWDYNSHYGFTRLTLSKPSSDLFQAFGHSVYAKTVMENNQPVTNGPNTNKAIEQPYTPVVEKLTLDYTTEEVLFSLHEVDEFYHVEAFGQLTQSLPGTAISNPLHPTTLLPQHAEEASFYIGLSNVTVPQSVSLLFQLVEGSGDATQSQIISQVRWFYLSGDSWKGIDRLRISKDSTRNLLNTGVIRFDLPKDMDANHRRMPDGLFWIKAAIPSNSGGIDRIQNVHAQAVEAIELAPELSNKVLSPNTITKLTDGNKGIANIEQPYASYGGTDLESEAGYYARVAERLRHKNRGINIWDYERLVLDSFPELYKVKCLNHTNYQTEMVAGHVMMAVIPNLRNKASRSPFQPKLSLHKRMEIYDHLRSRITPFIYLRVENPIYEPIQLSFNVGFHEGRDEGFYGQKLHQQLQEFLSPWAFETESDSTTDLVFGGELHKSVVLKFIEDLEYVDFVNDFNMYHRYQDPAIREHFENELENTNGVTDNASSHEDGACDVIKMAFQAGNTEELTSLIEIKLRFLKGIIEESDLASKLIAELTTVLNGRFQKGEAINKTLVRSIVKSIFYVDKIVDLQFYKDQPDGFVQEEVDVAVAKTSRSIMVSSEQHQIGVYKAGDYQCEGQIMIGIGFMIVEADFIVPEINQQNYAYQTR